MWSLTSEDYCTAEDLLHWVVGHSIQAFHPESLLQDKWGLPFLFPVNSLSCFRLFLASKVTQFKIEGCLPTKMYLLINCMYHKQIEKAFHFYYSTTVHTLYHWCLNKCSQWRNIYSLLSQLSEKFGLYSSRSVDIYIGEFISKYSQH